MWRRLIRVCRRSRRPSCSEGRDPWSFAGHGPGRRPQNRDRNRSSSWPPGRRRDLKRQSPPRWGAIPSSPGCCCSGTALPAQPSRSHRPGRSRRLVNQRRDHRYLTTAIHNRDAESAGEQGETDPGLSRWKKSEHKYRIDPQRSIVLFTGRRRTSRARLSVATPRGLRREGEWRTQKQLRR